MDALQRGIAIGVLGASGALLRYAVVEGWARAGVGPSWLATLIVNVSGCFLLGLVDRFALTGLIGPSTRLVIVVGFLGALTTFSSYARELVHLGTERDFVGLALEVVAQNVLGVLAVLAGMAVGAVLRP